MLMKALKYPFADQLTKSQLQAVGSLHTWPSLLAMLMWMVELILMVAEIQPSEYEQAHEDAPVDPKGITYRYLVKSYTSYLQGYFVLNFTSRR
jgi:kinetochore protein NDC80